MKGGMISSRYDAPYLNQPYEVAIETLTLCNAACTFCPYPTLDRRREEMDDRLLTRLIVEMMQWQHPFYISPFKVNEPLLDRRMPRILQTLDEEIPLARVRLFSNGTTLSSSAVSMLEARTNIEHLWISLNSMDAIEHQAMMKFAHPMFDRICQNIDSLHRARFPHPVVISRVAMGNEDDILFAERARTRWPKFQVVLIKRDGWLGFVPPSSALIPGGSCTRWWELSILSTGAAALCCMDGKGEYCVGDTNQRSLLEIYNQPLLYNRRKMQVSRRTVFPCETCTYG